MWKQNTGKQSLTLHRPLEGTSSRHTPSNGRSGGLQGGTRSGSHGGSGDSGGHGGAGDSRSHCGSTFEPAAPAPASASMAGALLPPPQKKKNNSLGIVGALSGWHVGGVGSWGRSVSAGSWGRSGSANTWGRSGNAVTWGRSGSGTPGGALTVRALASSGKL